MMDYEKIERYCTEQMSLEERGVFEEEMNADADLKREVEFFKNNLSDLISYVKDENSREELLETIKSKENLFNRETKTVKLIPRSRFLLRAVAVAAIFIVGFFILKPKPSLYEQYAIHENVEIGSRGDDLEDLKKGANKFNEESYAEAIGPLKDYLNANAEDVEIQMTLAICFLETDQVEQTLEILNSDLISNSIFVEKAMWYKALAFLKSNEIIHSKEALKSIGINSAYYQKAQNLLSDLG